MTLQPQKFQDLISEFLEENQIVYSLSEYASAYAKAVPSVCLQVSNKLTEFNNSDYFYNWLESKHRELYLDLHAKQDAGNYSVDLKVKDVRLHAMLNLAANILEANDRRYLITSQVRSKFNEYGFYE